MVTRISIPEELIAEFCRRHHIRKLALFGSVLRDDFRSDSDIDVVVEFESGDTPDFFRFIDIQDELASLLGRDVDLNTPNFLSRYFRDQVLAHAQVLYERAR